MYSLDQNILTKNSLKLILKWPDLNCSSIDPSSLYENPPPSGLGGDLSPGSSSVHSSSAAGLTPSPLSEGSSSISSSAAAAAASGTAGQLLSSFKGGAGSMLRNIKESSKAVVNSLLASKDLDFHLLTSRVAGMSCPSEGITDIGQFKNQIDDIR